VFIVRLHLQGKIQSSGICVPIVKESLSNVALSVMSVIGYFQCDLFTETTLKGFLFLDAWTEESDVVDPYASPVNRSTHTDVCSPTTVIISNDVN
jgi:hypothetical protein